jgi:Ca2+-binding RTX toxin-like protein
MTGGLGDDLYIVGDSGDIMVEAASAGTDTVQSSITVAALATNVENLTLTGTTAINGTGNTLANILTGNSAANALYGGSAADTLIGGAGNDTLDGGATADSMSGGTGDDLYVVDLATDILTEAASEGTDTVQSAVAWTLATNFENLTLTGSTGVAGTGNAVANILIGNSGANALSGLAGNDTITGGAGNDTVTGGIGADQFVFTTAANGIDVITDFNEVDGVGGEEGDVLRFDAASKVGVFVYLGTSAFSGGSDNSEARVVGNQVLFDANGDGTADITITLTGLTAASQLAATDFLFV